MKRTFLLFAAAFCAYFFTSAQGTAAPLPIGGVYTKGNDIFVELLVDSAYPLDMRLRIEERINGKAIRPAMGQSIALESYLRIDLEPLSQMKIFTYRDPVAGVPGLHQYSIILMLKDDTLGIELEHMVEPIQACPIAQRMTMVNDSTMHFVGTITGTIPDLPEVVSLRISNLYGEVVWDRQISLPENLSAPLQGLQLDLPNGFYVSKLYTEDSYDEFNLTRTGIFISNERIAYIR